MTDTLNILADLIAAAKKGGADAADAIAVEATSRGVSWREGRLEDVEGSEGEDIGLRVLIGRRQAIVSTSDRRPESLKAMVARTLDMARAVPEDEFCGLAPEELLLKGPAPALDLHDPTEISAERLGEMAAEAEAAARGVAGVTNSDGGGASAGSYAVTLMTSHGFAGAYRGTSFSASVSAVAGTGTGMERDYDFTSARHYADLKGMADVGRKAGEQAVARLGAAKLKSGSMTIIFSPRVSNSLVGHLTGAITGTAVARGTSFLKDQKGKPVFAPGVNIFDDPLIVRGLKSRPFDGEGLAVGKKALIEDGVLTGWLHNAASARQLKESLTGHASRGTSGPPGIATSNLYLAPGALSPEELMADITDGFYVTELIGMGVNGVTGDYSRGASGFRIRNGQIEGAVNEVTIASNLKEMFRRMVVASDLEFRYAVNAPTVRIDGMTVAGA
ncbi:TldD/PmbA family protein [Gimibacter soli]|uniref:TldD/PmbA family protein n=1 Tax=Gimibacter soli TaxID=3024400 RepID=A0AAF0BM02_9PROT|nr:TldD/PmbA family protein [Gimibacter soli]WCL53821.1 TldD/PmbA family protein [Gimibacter soli]